MISVIFSLLMLFGNNVDKELKIRIKNGMVGDIKIGMTVGDVTNNSAIMSKCTLSNIYDEEGNTIPFIRYYVVKNIPAHVGFIDYGNNFKVGYIDIYDPMFITDKAVYIGMKFSNIIEIYGKDEVMSKLFNYVGGTNKLLSINVKEEKLYLYFDTENIPLEWFQKKKKDLYKIKDVKLKSIRLY